MAFSVSWHRLLDELEALSEGTTLITPLSHTRFRATDVQVDEDRKEPRIEELTECKSGATFHTRAGSEP